MDMVLDLAPLTVLANGEIRRSSMTDCVASIKGTTGDWDGHEADPVREKARDDADEAGEESREQEDEGEDEDEEESDRATRVQSPKSSLSLTARLWK